ncbi:MAG: nicotinate-nucleotide--dimethylbenzimidazole phosphoribosyltransferase [Candidatus Pseudobacter hemicellulosilyticus]|uniref:Nicotinate-nucleotide--dimethylbenzimidazole phosphoribosyltransferase n=1 Tax=Candidatus Pseudobacter hemicellulosilyticus TaxID=3121375 RepID=A0AAJ5WVR2_9BACT|nr:MAG: nicotinate-nucleotide--dimethylbenzimidazole phosphoribosyltransferase [Pseudobacter sp.]
MASGKTMASLTEKLQQRINAKTKPPGSLGRLEEIALQVGLIQETLTPVITYPHIIVFAGDHGIAKTGLVNPYPQEVTAQMVLNFLQGGAAINVFCRQHGLTLKVVDAGVNFDWNQTLVNPDFLDMKIGHGTASYLDGPAMTADEVLRAIGAGRQLVDIVAGSGCNCLGFGEMGIGNTSSAALILSAVTGLPVEDCAGRGTGVNDQQLQTKIETLQKVHAFHRLQELSESPLPLLAKVGGYEIAMMTGAYLEAMERHMVIVVDGFITTAALLIARQLNPAVMEYCLFAHTSGEQGHEKMLHWLGVQPLLQLGMRLGEGTGAAMAIPLICSAVNFLNEMASFESAGVSNKE